MRPFPLDIDVHVHLAAIPDGRNACYISPKMLNGVLFKSLLKNLELDPRQPEVSNELYIQKLHTLVKESRYVKQVILLAMDGVYDANGRLNKEETHFIVANDYVLATVRRFPDQFKAGASINPNRLDAVAELHRVADAGAVLIKVLPNSQQFNPADRRHAAFWKAMADRRIPLLSHIGYEFSLWGKDQSVGDPLRLRDALEAGVTVIAAHGGSFGLFIYEKYWDTLCDFARRYPQFYWDASALSLPNRAGMLLRLARHPELHERMVFGTDYPLTSFAFPALLAGHLQGWLELRRMGNPFDRHFRLLQMLGLV